jgi:hypothetical protein
VRDVSVVEALEEMRDAIATDAAVYAVLQQILAVQQLCLEELKRIRK